MTGRALAILIWVITLASVGLFFSGWWFPPAISEYAAGIDRQFMLTIIIVGVAFVAAQVGLGYAIWRFRARPDDSSRATYSHGSNRLEILWTVITAFIFIGIGLLGQRVWAQMHFNEAPQGAMQVEVVAQQFAWNFHYPGADARFGRTDPRLVNDANANPIGLDTNDPSAQDDAQVSTLIVPVNQTVELIMRSKDVTHDLWVPQLRIKQDIVPGLQIRMHFTPNQVGRYEIACAELCGAQHYRMKAFMLVVTVEEHRELMSLPQNEFTTRVGELLRRYPTALSN